MNNVNTSIKKIKEQQIQTSEENNKELEKKINEILLILIGLFTTLSMNYNMSNKYRQLRIMKNIERELIKYRKFLVDYQKEFLEKTLKSTFNKNYNELYMVLKLLYNNDIPKSTFTEESIDKIIHSKFFNKTLNKRIADNTTLIFNKINKEVSTKIIEDIDTTAIVEVLNNNFDSLIKIENRLLDTEDTRLFNEAQKKAFNDFGIEHLIWCSVLCKNTCSKCASNDSQAFSIKDIDMIPLHSRCNCYWEIV